MTKRVSLTIFVLTWLLSLDSYAIAKSATAKTTAVKAPEEKVLSVDQIVDRTNHVAYYQGIDGRAKVKMTITDSQGRKRMRELTILRWDQPDPNLPKKKKRKDSSFCGEQRIYAFFNRPADVYRTVFMVWKHLHKDDDRWMYLPALDLVKRISATDKRTSFIGSHFFYEDISGRNINDDVHKLVKTTKDYYVLKNTPKKPKLVEFAYFEMWIHRKSFIVVKTDYYDKQKRKYRTYQALKVKRIQGYPTVVKSRMTDLRTKGNTLLEYTDVKYDIGIPKSIFTERYLRKPARKYLK